MRDLYGDHVPVKFVVDQADQLKLFTPEHGWRSAAMAWAHDQRRIITKWFVDQRFELGASAGNEATDCSISWDDLTRAWIVS